MNINMISINHLNITTSIYKNDQIYLLEVIIIWWLLTLIVKIMVQ